MCNLPPTRSRAMLALVMSGAFLLAASNVKAQVVLVPAEPQIGSSNPVTADPAVPRPHTKPCTVQLFQNEEFADFNTKNFTYAPPANCHGPWAKVVFTGDFTVTVGRQFDRTTQIYLGGANLFFGTTAEPRATLSPSWHVESDVTDLSALFQAAQSGTAILGNFVGVSGGVDYTGIIFGNAALEFYPASFIDPAPRVPNVVIGIPGNGGAATLNDTTSQLSQSVTLPTNVESAYLDVIAQSQSNDEFWYLCVPNDLTGTLQSCGNTGFRETEVSIDGQPAGVAPVYPWIYTGGIDPSLWEPIPGVQTLNFKPYRVDLTPFAGLLSNGQPHTVALSVFNSDSYFAATSTLLAYTDPGSKKITGGILSNNLAAEPTPTIKENITTDASGDASGTVTVASARNFTISGYINTSHGRVETTVNQTINFQNTQKFLINATTYDQDLVQSTDVTTKTTTRDGLIFTQNEKTFSYPFTFNFDEAVNADGSLTVVEASDQKYLTNGAKSLEGFNIFSDKTSNEVASHDTMNYDSSGNFVGQTTASSQNYLTNNSLGYCYSRSITSAQFALTNVTDGKGCPQHWPFHP